MCQAFALAISGYQGTRRVLELAESEEDITRLHEALRQGEMDDAEHRQPPVASGLGEQLLNLVHARGAALVEERSIICFGHTPTPEAIRAQLDWLRAQTDEAVFCTDHLGDLFAPARIDPYLASGLLAVRVSHYGHSGERVFMWWRPEQPQTVTWAGDPRKSALRDTGKPMLSPRASFEQWVEITTGHSEPWSTGDLLRARKFRSLLLRDINADLISP